MGRWLGIRVLAFALRRNIDHQELWRTLVRCFPRRDLEWCDQLWRDARDRNLERVRARARATRKLSGVWPGVLEVPVFDNTAPGRIRTPRRPRPRRCP